MDGVVHNRVITSSQWMVHWRVLSHRKHQQKLLFSSVSGWHTINWNLSSANCRAGILKNEKPIAASVSFLFFNAPSPLLFSSFFCFFFFFFPHDTWWGWYSDGYRRKYGKKKLAGALRSLKRWKNLFMANVRTEPYCDKVESDRVLREEKIPKKTCDL